MSIAGAAAKARNRYVGQRLDPALGKEPLFDVPAQAASRSANQPLLNLSFDQICKMAELFIERTGRAHLTVDFLEVLPCVWRKPATGQA
jgi:hypothetical protein